MSHSYPTTDYQKLDNKDVLIHLSSNYSNNELSLSDTVSDSPPTSLSPTDKLSEKQVPNGHVVNSCFWSTTIFSVNFISSILIINLAKW